MNTMDEAKSAASRLSPREKYDLFRWLGDSPDVAKQKLEELRREIAKGVEDARLGRVSTLDAEEIISRGRKRLAQGKQS